MIFGFEFPWEKRARLKREAEERAKSTAAFLKRFDKILLPTPETNFPKALVSTPMSKRATGARPDLVAAYTPPARPVFVTDTRAEDALITGMLLARSFSSVGAETTVEPAFTGSGGSFGGGGASSSYDSSSSSSSSYDSGSSSSDSGSSCSGSD